MHTATPQRQARGRNYVALVEQVVRDLTGHDRFYAGDALVPGEFVTVLPNGDHMTVSNMAGGNRVVCTESVETAAHSAVSWMTRTLVTYGIAEDGRFEVYVPRSR